MNTEMPINDLILNRQDKPPLTIQCPANATTQELFAVMQLLFTLSSPRSFLFYDVEGFIKKHGIERFFVEKE